MILGLVLVRALNLGRRQKVALLFVLLMGCIPPLASCVRYYFISNILISNQTATLLADLDAILLWSQLDAQFAMYATCLPAFRAFLRGGSGPRFNVNTYLRRRNTRSTANKNDPFSITDVNNSTWDSVKSVDARTAEQRSMNGSDNIELLAINEFSSGNAVSGSPK